MDIDLLAKMVGELIVDHDQVGLPGVGTFVAEMVPATFSDKGFTINPPYRRLSFYPSRLEDTLLIDLYAKTNRIDRETAALYITQYLAELKSVLEERKNIALPGLGRLRATRENHLFFVADEGLDIFPAGVGLRPVSLKSHLQEDDPVVIAVPMPAPPQEVPVEMEPTGETAPEADSERTSAAETPADGFAAMEPPIAEIPAEEFPDEEQPAGETIPETDSAEELPSEEMPEGETPEEEMPKEEIPGEEISEEEMPEEGIPEEVIPLAEAAREETSSDEAPAGEQPGRTPRYGGLPDWAWTDPGLSEPEDEGPRRFPVWLAVLIVLVVLFFGGFILLAHLAPDFIDSILYSPDELWIIKY